MARESLALPLSTLCVVEYNSDGDKVQYGLNDRSLLRAHPPAPQETLAYLTVEFDQGVGQVDTDPLNFEAINFQSVKYYFDIKLKHEF